MHDAHPEETQGPFWVDERLLRSDVRADSATGAVQAGVPLTLTINLQDAGADCCPQVGAYVDIWHANAQGTYSDVSGVRLLRGDDVLADRRFGWLPRGRSTLRLRVPRSVEPGKAKVLVTLADKAGNTKAARLRVHVPKS